ncbi:GDSL esterase/lipase [Capsicum annuum]|nr:GDSL esterase/lipase [Capsicum annuum]
MEACYNNIPWVIIIVFILVIIIIPCAVGGKVPAIIVFGDSTVDSGNNNQILTIVKSNFEPYGRDFYDKKPTGRFSNGRIPTDLMSEAFGLRPFVPAYLDPMYNISDFALGVCFASAGSGWDTTTNQLANVMPLWKQVENFKEYQKKLETYVGANKSNYIIQEALYVVSTGTNDFLNNYYSPTSTRALHYTIEQFQGFLIGLIENFIKQIYQLGARKISFTGLPPIGCVPMERAVDLIQGRGDTCIEKYNDVALHFNDMLSGLVHKLNGELPGLRMVFANPYDALLQMIKDPSSFGFEVTGIACCGTGLFEASYLCNKLQPLTCPDADKFVFWDSFHPTQKTNQILVNSMMKNVLNQFL